MANKRLDLTTLQVGATETEDGLGGLDMNNQKLPNLLDPTVDQDAATKKYVDDTAGSGDVVGPGGSVDGEVATFDGSTGKIIQDSGIASDKLIITEEATLTDGDLVVGAGSKDIKAPTGPISAVSQRITNVGNPSVGTDALNLQTGNILYSVDNSKIINTGGASIVPIVDDLQGTGIGFNVSYDQNTQQFVIDTSAYTGVGTSASIIVERKTMIDVGAVIPVEKNGFGLWFLTPLAPLGNPKYFPVDPEVFSAPEPALSSDFRFSTSTSRAANSWDLVVRCAGSDFDQVFFIDAIQLNEGGLASINVRWSYTNNLI